MSDKIGNKVPMYLIFLINLRKTNDVVEDLLV